MIILIRAGLAFLHGKVGVAERLSYHAFAYLFVFLRIVHDLAEAAAMLMCFAKGLCVASRASVEKPTRSQWPLDEFLWF